MIAKSDVNLGRDLLIVVLLSVSGVTKKTINDCQCARTHEISFALQSAGNTSPNTNITIINNNLITNFDVLLTPETAVSLISTITTQTMIQSMNARKYRP